MIKTWTNTLIGTSEYNKGQSPRHRRIIEEDRVIETWTNILIETGIIKERDFSIED